MILSTRLLTLSVLSLSLTLTATTTALPLALAEAKANADPAAVAETNFNPFSSPPAESNDPSSLSSKINLETGWPSSASSPASRASKQKRDEPVAQDGEGEWEDEGTAFDVSREINMLLRRGGGEGKKNEKENEKRDAYMGFGAMREMGDGGEGGETR